MSVDPQKLIADVARYIDESNQLISRGEFVQLNGLDKQISKLCAEVLELSGEQRTLYAVQLQEIITSLSQLQDNMIIARENLNKQIGGLSSHKQANIAYQKSEVVDKKDQSE